MNPKIAVIGSLNMDIVVHTPRFPLQGETLLGDKISHFPGGKGANQAVGAARLGAEVKMIGCVGKDANGDELKKSLKKSGVDVSSIGEVEEVSTGTAMILLANTDNSIIVIPGANGQCSPAIIEQYIQVIKESDIVLIQMEIPLETVFYAIRTAKKFNKIVVLNPAPAQQIPTDILACVDYITPNETELAILTRSLTKSNDLEGKMDALLSEGVQHVITTLGSKGVAYKGTGQCLQQLPGYKVPVVDTTGAGDTFNAGFAYSLGIGRTVLESLQFASIAAALAIGKTGAQTGMPTLKEVETFTVPFSS